MNKPNLIALRNLIESLPDHKINLGYIATIKSDEGYISAIDTDRLRDFNTSGCVAGYTCFLFGVNAPAWQLVDAPTVAKGILELDDAVSNVLFDIARQEEYHQYKSHKSIALARLSKLIGEAND